MGRLELPATGSTYSLGDCELYTQFCNHLSFRLIQNGQGFKDRGDAQAAHVCLLPVDVGGRKSRSEGEARGLWSRGDLQMLWRDVERGRRGIKKEVRKETSRAAEGIRYRVSPVARERRKGAP